MIGETLMLSLHVFLDLRAQRVKDHLAAVYPNPIRRFDQAAAIAEVFFRFLRCASRPIIPRPPAKSGRAAGRGVALTDAEAISCEPVNGNSSSSFVGEGPFMSTPPRPLTHC